MSGFHQLYVDLLEGDVVTAVQAEGGLVSLLSISR